MKCFDGLKIAAIVLCAGKGERTGLPYNKLLHRIGVKTVAEKTVEAFAETGLFSEIVCTASESDIDEINSLVGSVASVCVGGETRTDSVKTALASLSSDTDIVLIHDGARPFVSEKIIRDVIGSAAKFGSGIPAVAVVDSVKEIKDDKIVGSPDRSSLVNVQTPQAFSYREIVDAYSRIDRIATDDSEIYRLAGYTPRITAGEYTNRKITTAADIFGLSDGYKIGFGYDVHRLVADRRLILGGVEIAYEKGLLGHSDADVLTHAVMDALLGGAGLPDIGVLFPDTDLAYEGISSMVLLSRVTELVKEKDMRVLGLSCTVMAERPKLAKLIPSIRSSLADALGVSTDVVNVSATTTEKLGIVGDGAGIASAACVLLGL